MTVDTFLDNLQKERGIKVSANDGKLRIRGDKKLLTPNILDEIGTRKAEILTYFRETTVSALTATPEKDKYSLSPAQRRIYFMYEFDKNSVAYNIQDAIRITGKFDRSRIAEAFREIAQRHDILRTTFNNVDGDIYQRISSEATIDVVSLDPSRTDNETISEFTRPFDLAQLPLFRVGVKTTGDDETLIVVDVHHIITDGVSQRIMLKEFMSLLHGQSLPSVSFQYKDFAEWQLTDTRKTELDKQKRFWLKEFEEVPGTLELPFDFSRPEVKTNRGAVSRFTIGSEQAARLRQIAEDEGVTLFVLILAIYYILLSKVSNQENVTVGTPVDGRQHKGLEGMIGIFINTLTLKTRVHGKKSFREFLSDVKDNVLESYLNQDYQYDSLIDELKIDRSTGDNPLFNAMLSYKNLGEVDLQLKGLSVDYVKAERTQAKLDITLFAEETKNGVVLDFLYATDSFKAETIERFSTYFKAIVSTVISNVKVSVADIDILPDAEKTRLLKEFNSAATPVVEDSILTLIEGCSRQFPDNKAVVCGDTLLTYRELSEKSDRLASMLLNTEGVTGLVPISVQSSVSLMVAILGVWKAGKAYIPVDPDQNSARTAAILEETKCKVVVTDTRSLDSLNFDAQRILVDSDLPEIKNYSKPKVKGDDLAYVIYTSGSSGKPKGTKITHRNLANYASWLKDTIKLTAADKSLLTSSYAFDLGYSSIFPVLIAGGALHIAPRSLYESPDQLTTYIHTNGITYLKMTPSLFSTIVRTGNFTAMEDLKYVLLGGEKLVAADVATAASDCKHVTFINHYGPTETTVGVVAHEIKDPLQLTDRCVIGKPIANTKAYILDRDGNLLPQGVFGELCIGGASVGAGYLDRDELTKEKFASLPVAPEENIYRTGDLARWLPDGAIELKGRIDNQVKIRGYRIEPDEISRTIETLTGIVKAAVIAVGKDNSKHLAAYYLSDSGVTGQAIREFLLKKLPEYMIPSFFMKLERFPLTPNGKLDVRSLPPIVHSVSIQDTEITNEEKILLEVWSAVLANKNISVDDNFFFVGGDSIKSILISSRLRKLGYELTVRDIFKSQTIRSLAPQMKKAIAKAPKANAPGKSKLTPIQREFFLNESIRSKNHYNQSVALDLDERLSKETVEKIFRAIVDHHDALRSAFKKEGNEILQHVERNDVSSAVEVHDFRLLSDAAFLSEFLTAAEIMQSALDVATGSLIRVALFKREHGSRLLIVIHHLVVDGVSWRILLDDIGTLLQQSKEGKPLTLPARTDAFTQWSGTLMGYMQTKAFKDACVYWKNFRPGKTQSLPGINSRGKHYFTDSSTETFTLDSNLTSGLLTDVNRSFNTAINDTLLAALALSFDRLYGNTAVTIDMEGHGREKIHAGANLERTVGWFTSIYPVVLNTSSADIGEVIIDVKETLRQVPNNGIDYLLFKQFVQPMEGSDNEERPRIRFNYLGQVGNDGQEQVLRLYTGPMGSLTSTQNLNRYQWDISGVVINGRLEMRLNYSASQFPRQAIRDFMASYQQSLTDIIGYCLSLKTTISTPSDFTYKKLSASVVKEICQAHDVEDICPLSPMQKGMFFHSLWNNDTESYFEQKCLYVKGRVNVAVMEESLRDLTKRYQVLRSTFRHKGYDEPFQVILREGNTAFSFEDIRNESIEDKQVIVESCKRDDRAKPFILDEDALIRLKVLQTGDSDYVLLWSYHHILMDGWCMAIVVNDFNEIYRSRISGSVPTLQPVRSYVEYLDWLSAKDTQADSEYWKKYLDGVDVQTVIPKIASWTPQTPYRQVIRTMFLSKKDTAGLTATSVSCGVTQNSILQLAWAVVLSRYNNVNDVVFGSVVSGRPAEIEGVESIVGLFINTVPIRVTFDGNDLAQDVLKKINEHAIESEPHHHTPLFETQAKSELGRELIDHIMIMENYPVSEELKGTSRESDLGYYIDRVEIFEQTNYGLELNIVPGNELELRFIYDGNKYDQKIVERLSGHFSNALKHIYSNPGVKISEIDILTTMERDELLLNFNDTLTDIDRTKTYFSLFAEQVRRTPGNVAVEHNGVKLTYHQLHDTAVALAGEFRKQGLRENGRTALFLPRGIQMLKSILATYCCGAAYVPIDVEFPAQRIGEILTDCEPTIVVADSSSVGQAQDILAELEMQVSVVISDDVFTNQYSPETIGADPDPDGIAYIIYTSGTTGKPKGAMVHQLGLVNHLHALVKSLELSSSDSIAQTASPCFDISVWQFLCALIVGGKTHIVDKAVVAEPLRLVKMLKRSGVTVFQSVPSLLSTLLLQLEDDATIELPKLRWIIPTGEQLNSSLVDQLHRYFPDVRMLNAYGPAEASDDVSIYEVGSTSEPAGPVPVGKPIQNTHIYIVDQFKHLSPKGIAGEICVSGVSVGKGYWKDAGKTKDSFISNPFGNDLKQPDDHRVMYKTGDLGYWNENGNLVCIGRKDDQVKIRGARIELAEIQNAILSHKDMRGAVVVVRGEAENKNLVGYYVAGRTLSKDEVREHVASKLPQYLIPPYLIQIPSVPVTANGKVDKKALPDPDIKETGTQLPANDVELKLAAMWGEVLNTEATTLTTDVSFFEIGGHSLRATTLINKINKGFNLELSLMDIFEKQTIKEQAELISINEWLADPEQIESKREVTI